MQLRIITVHHMIVTCSSLIFTFVSHELTSDSTSSKYILTLPNTPGPLTTVRLTAIPLVTGSDTVTASED